MKSKTVLTALLAGSICLVLAGCSAGGDEVIPETSYKSLLKMTLASAADSDNFGYSIALDGNFAFIGAPGVDGEGTDRGAAYLFLKTQGGTDGWGQVKELVAGDAGDADYFGVSVDLSGDYAVVGAVGENGTGTNQGAAYVFYRNQGGADNWGQVIKLVSGDPVDLGEFGTAVAIDGDLVLVGASGEDGAGTSRGAAYLFARDQGGAGAWGQVKKMVPGTPTDGAWFGNAVALAGSLAAVGEPWSDGAGTNRGSVYIFAKDEGGTDNWGQFRKITASDAADGAFFGYSVCLSGSTLLVGAVQAPGGGTQRGQAYLYAKDEGGTDAWGEVQRLRASDAQNQDYFGYASAILGSYVLVGAVGEDGSGAGRGAAYLFKKS
jgi:FG-GAP repeat